MQVLNILLVVLVIFPIFSTAQAVEFDARDVRIDLPVLSIPNNAVSPDIASDNNGHVYIVWSDNRGGTSSIYVNTFLPYKGWLSRAIPINTGFPKTGEIGEATSPKVCADDSGHVYVAWVDDRAVKAHTGGRDIYFRYSKDYGYTWYPEFTDERIDTDSPNIGNSFNHEIACDGNGNVYVVWEDNRNRAAEIYFRSLQIQFSKPTDFIAYHQTPDVRLNTGVNAGRFNAGYPVISTDKSGNVYAAWQDTRNIPEDSIFPGIYFNSSNNHGIKWNSEAIRIDRSPIGGFITFSPPVLSSDSSGHVYAAWLDTAGRAERGEEFASDGTLDVYFNRSNDYGVTWEEDISIEGLDITAVAKDVTIANNNKGVIFIVWSDNRASDKVFTDEYYNIFSNHSEDYGYSFLDTKDNIRIDTWIPQGLSEAARPVAKVDSRGNVFVTWMDKYPDTFDIFFNFSTNMGKKDTWLEYGMLLDHPTPPGNSINPKMSIDNSGNVYVTWQDSRVALVEENYNIFFISGFLDIETLLIGGQKIGEECFIATAAYGSPFEHHVMILRKFRDRYLMTNSPGQWLVSLYYHLSPPIADFISGHDYLKGMVRITLLPVVGIAILTLHTTFLQKVVLILLVLGVMSVTFWIINRKTIRP